jgi:hypothetical protein
MKTKKSIFVPLATVLLLGLAAQFGHAADLRPDGGFVTAGIAPKGTASLGTGLVWDWDWRAERRALLTAQTELIVAGWRADAVGSGSQQLAQLAVLPVLKMRLDRGRSPWFVEFGIGASYTSKLYVTDHKEFSTRWNFYDMLGVGHSFGEGRRQELGLRYVHTSNASIRSPNPGEDFLQLRYGFRF